MYCSMTGISNVVCTIIGNTFFEHEPNCICKKCSEYD